MTELSLTSINHSNEVIEFYEKVLRDVKHAKWYLWNSIMIS